MSSIETKAIETLLQKAEKLRSELDDDQLPILGMPRIERNLKQLETISKDLWSRTNYSTSRDSCDIRASVLLGSKGYDLQKVSQHLDSLSTGKKQPILESTVKEVNDLQSFLKSEREGAFLSVIDKVKSSTLETINKNYWNFMENEWNNYKSKILHPFIGPDGTVDHLDFSILSSKEFETKLSLTNQNDSISESLRPEDIKNIESIINRIAVDQAKSLNYEEEVDRLYRMGSHTKAVTLLNSHLSGIVCEKKLSNTKRERMEYFALKLAERFCTSGHNSDKDAAGVLYLLLDLMTFFDYYHSQAYNDALDTIQRLNIIPVNNSDIKSKVNQFGQLSEEVRRNIPEVLIATMEILYSQYQEIRISHPQVENKFGIFSETLNAEELSEEIKKKARALITYAGMIAYRIEHHLSSKLVQLELKMN